MRRARVADALTKPLAELAQPQRWVAKLRARERAKARKQLVRFAGRHDQRSQPKLTYSQLRTLMIIAGAARWRVPRSLLGVIPASEEQIRATP